MARPDLKGSFGGWQALDATPQELSPHTKTMVVGPAPVQVGTVHHNARKHGGYKFGAMPMHPQSTILYVHVHKLFITNNTWLCFKLLRLVLLC